MEPADGTAWMAFFSQNMFEIALELAAHDPVYEDLAAKFAEHLLWIASAMDRVAEHHDEMWDEQDGFFYDLLRFPDGAAVRLKVRSMVGLLPLAATTVISRESARRFPLLIGRVQRFLKRHPGLNATAAPITKAGAAERLIFSVLNETKLRRVLSKMLSEDEFLSPYGIRSLSRFHLEHPYVFRVRGEEYNEANSLDVS
jgi:hypothetical protein